MEVSGLQMQEKSFHYTQNCCFFRRIYPGVPVVIFGTFLPHSKVCNAIILGT